MTRLLPSLLLILAPSARAAEPRCRADAPAPLVSLRAIVATVNAGSRGRLTHLVDSAWAPEAIKGRSRAGVLTDLASWHWRSRTLQVESLCAVDATSGYALVRNTLSEEVDSLFVQIDSAKRSIVGATVRSGVRVFTSPSETSSDAARVAAVQRLANRLSGAGVFSGVVLLARNGRPLLRAAYGSPTRPRGRPTRVTDRYSIASMGKLFTATAFMRLVEAGRVRLTDPIGAILPDSVQGPSGDYFRLSSQVRGVPLQYVLTHTSGIEPGRDSLAFAPGTQWAYSNYGFYLLGRALEFVNKTSLETHFQRALFDVAGMHDTHVLVTDKVVDTLPPNYMRDFDDTGFVLKQNPLVQTIAGSGAGNLFSTVDDLLRFAEAFRRGRLVTPAGVERMRTPDATLGASDYGLGVVRWRGPGVWGHAGDLPGADADLELYGDSGYVLIILSNMDGVNNELRRKVQALLETRSQFGGVVVP